MAGGKLGRGAGRLTGVDLDWAGVIVVVVLEVWCNIDGDRGGVDVRLIVELSFKFSTVVLTPGSQVDVAGVQGRA